MAAAGDRCVEFLRIVDGNETFTTRVADTLLHDHRRMGETAAAKLLHHKAKQREILDLFAGCEKQIFNDPEVKYTFRNHFNGKTGTMSNILTSGYFVLYDRLLNGPYGIEVNALDDLVTVFHLASSLTVRDNAFVMDSDEFEAMKRIILRLQSMLPENTLFTEQWFRTYTEFLRAIHREALEKYTYYRNDPSHQTVTQAMGWKVPRLKEAEQKVAKEKYFIRSFNHDLYEYYPPYMNVQYYNAPIEEYFTKLPALAQLFTHPRETRLFEVPAKKTTKKNGRGGYRTLKRKASRSSRRRAHSLQ